MSFINCIGWALLSRSIDTSMPGRNKFELGTSLVMTHCLWCMYGFTVCYGGIVTV